MYEHSHGGRYQPGALPDTSNAAMYSFSIAQLSQCYLRPICGIRLVHGLCCIGALSRSWRGIGFM
jgi:hypothetical protein